MANMTDSRSITSPEQQQELHVVSVEPHIQEQLRRDLVEQPTRVRALVMLCMNYHCCDEEKNTDATLPLDVVMDVLDIMYVRQPPERPSFCVAQSYNNPRGLHQTACWSDEYFSERCPSCGHDKWTTTRHIGVYVASFSDKRCNGCSFEWSTFCMETFQ
eukprot:PhM_4_TR423/c4_g2_i1/m.71487